MKHKYDIDMYLVAMDLMAEMKLLTDLDIWIDGGLSARYVVHTYQKCHVKSLIRL